MSGGDVDDPATEGSEEPRARGRPRVSSRDALERVAVGIFLEYGYEATTVDDICRAGSVSRTTFFRYFSGKSEVVWYGFDQQRERLEIRLAHSDRELPAMTVMRQTVVQVAREHVEGSDLWRERFRMYDSVPSLRAEEAARWQDWKDVLSAFIVERGGVTSDTLVPVAVAGAVQSMYVTLLRECVQSRAPWETFVHGLETRLAPLGAALQGLIDSVRRSTTTTNGDDLVDVYGRLVSVYD